MAGDDIGLQASCSRMASVIILPSRDWSRSTPRYRTDVLAVTYVLPHVTFISELMRRLLLVPKRIHSVFPNWMDSLLSTNHPLREESSLCIAALIPTLNYYSELNPMSYTMANILNIILLTINTFNCIPVILELICD